MNPHPHQTGEDERLEAYKAMWDKGEFEWNYHPHDNTKKPINPMRIWNTFILPLIQEEAQKRHSLLTKVGEEVKKMESDDVYWCEGNTSNPRMLEIAENTGYNKAVEDVQAIISKHMV